MPQISPHRIFCFYNTLTEISALFTHPEHQRNICILAHVDHGKTSLSDNLLSSNGIISVRQSGQLRFLDFRHDEQERLITMKSTAIALLFNKNDEDYLINLVDSPGHVDFTGEVSAAVRITDGALVLVDAVEGVCVQTRTVLRQAWEESLKPILVINKMDRLFNELFLTPNEIYKRVRDLIEQINAIIGTLVAEVELKQQDSDNHEENDPKAKELLELKEKEFSFSPEKGNVIFASAIDHWAFSISDFVHFYAEKFKMNEKVLSQTLWGEYYLDLKSKKLFKKPQEHVSDPMFAQLIIKPIYDIYNATEINFDLTKLEKILQNLNIPLNKRLISDKKALLSTILEHWLPLPRCILNTVIDIIPSPLEAQKNKIEKLLWRLKNRSGEKEQKLLNSVQNCDSNAETVAFIAKVFPFEKTLLPKNETEGMMRISFPKKRPDNFKRNATPNKELEENQANESPKTDNQEVINHNDVTKDDQKERIGNEQNDVAKEEQLTENKEQASNNDDLFANSKNVFISVVRVYSGTIKVGDKLKLLQSNYSGNSMIKEEQEVSIDNIYMLMGNSLSLIPEAKAGSIVGLCLGRKVFKTATLTNSPVCPLLKDLNNSNAQPIIRVAVDTIDPTQRMLLGKALSLLAATDPACKCMLLSSGEYVILAAGEVHFERCLTDLKELFIDVPIVTSSPLVPFKETVLNMAPAEVKKAQLRIDDEGSFSSLFIPMVPMQNNDVDLLGNRITQDANYISNEQISDIKQEHVKQLLQRQKKNKLPLSPQYSTFTPDKDYQITIRALALPLKVIDIIESNTEIIEALSNRNIDYNSVEHFVNQLSDGFKSEKGWKNWDKNILAFGPNASGTNLLFIGTETNIDCDTFFAKYINKKDNSTDNSNILTSAIENGFRIAVKNGPLCGEVMTGVAIIVNIIKQDTETPENRLPISYMGQLTAICKEMTIKAISELPQRLVEPMFACEIHVSADYVGSVYKVLSKRKAVIISEDVLDASSMFIIKSSLPVAESFGFSEELRKYTSGHAVPQLEFSHFVILQEDPYWEPTTEEEIEFYGVKGDVAINRARRYVDDTRKRKGLPLLKKLVEEPEKQRTLSKKK